jgi:diguanylate cyclase (GGDEF)-like protein
MPHQRGSILLPRPALHRLAHRGATVPICALIVVLLAVLAIGSAQMMTRTTADVRVSTEISDAYQRARYALAQEQEATLVYRLTADPSARARAHRAAADLNAALAVTRRQGTTADRWLATDVLTTNQHVLTLIDDVIAAVNHNRADRAEQANNELDTLLPDLLRRLDRAAGAHQLNASQAHAESRNGERVMIAVTIAAFLLGLLLVLAFAAVVRYREQLEAARAAEVERLRSAAFTDNLTGLQNHRAFQEDLERRLNGGDAQLSLALIDLDDLKRANDLHGHQVGDECLIALGAALGLAAGDGDGAYRVGGDEFALLLDDAGAVQALNTVQRLQATLGRTPSGLAVAATAGVAHAEPGCDRTGLLRRADLALIQAKRLHRGAMIYTPDLEPILHSPDEAEESRHRGTLATALARAVDAKDAYTHSHCETVAELCAMIGYELGLDAAHLSRLRLAGLLHDVGKIGIPDTILHKPGPLNDDEYAVMKTHPTLGHDIVVAAERQEEAYWILHHHERIDGAGYPDGLAGEQIPLESRIILVADAFEAITADRPYRQHRTVDEAIGELRRAAGTQFDPRCVAALERAIGHRGLLAA